MHFRWKYRLVYIYSGKFTIYQFFFTDMCYNKKQKYTLREA